jgi:uncharacterized protein (TIGR02265 family)
VSTGRHVEEQFREPAWQAPLDANAVIQTIPRTCTLSGMFFESLAGELRKRGLSVRGSEEPYLHFRFYPLRDFARMLVDAAPLLHPKLSLRQGLRKLGRAAPTTLLASTVGRVVLASAEGVQEVLSTLSRTYPINMRPGTAELVDRTPTSMIIRLSEVHHFLDSHHVGILEGTMRHAGVRGSVRIRPLAPGAMDFLCSWR